MMAYLRQIFLRLTADKKKLSIMVGLMAVLLLLWGRLLLKEVPRTATATPAVTKINPFWKPPAKESSATAINKVEVSLPESLDRDLFTLDLGGYVSTAARAIVEVKTEKSDPKPTDENLQAALVRQAAMGMKLQTTLLAGRRLAMINGHLLKEGQTINGFEVVQILHRQVILRMNGIEVQLEM